ncbi:MAG TPA: CHASE2 domain-containing protein, partial [Geminicoccaceae bacterium]|nr:CHASE2 domain-containing protein [Geminicoccaceae bacterium]
RGTRPAPEEAVVVRFDRDALARLRALAEEGPPQAWPQPLAGCRERHGGLDRLGDASGLDRLPRVVQACLVEELTRRGAAAIAFDISFRRDPAREEGVQALADAIRAHGRVVLLENAVRNWLPAAVERAKPGAAVQTDVVEKPHAALAAAAVATAPFLLPRGSARVHQSWAFNHALPSPTQLPVRALEALALPAMGKLAAAGGEIVPPATPPAEALRRYTTWFRSQPADGLEGLRRAGLLSTGEQGLLAALERVYRGPDHHYLGFYGPSGTFPSLSAADLLAPEPRGRGAARAVDLGGRVVFVGYQELAIPQASDSFPTAFQSGHGVNLSGVEIAATSFANLLHGETLRALPEWARVALVAALGVALTLASCLGMVWRGLAATLALVAAYGAVAVALFVLRHVWLPVAVPLLGLLPLAVVLGQVVHYLGAAR